MNEERNARAYAFLGVMVRTGSVLTPVVAVLLYVYQDHPVYGNFLSSFFTSTLTSLVFGLVGKHLSKN